MKQTYLTPTLWLQIVAEDVITQSNVLKETDERARALAWEYIKKK